MKTLVYVKVKLFAFCLLADDGISERSCGWIDAGWQLSLFCPFWAERSKRGAREEGRKSGFAGGKMKREKKEAKAIGGQSEGEKIRFYRCRGSIYRKWGGQKYK